MNTAVSSIATQLMTSDKLELAGERLPILARASRDQYPLSICSPR
jgi:hypothetical protein